MKLCVKSVPINIFMIFQRVYLRLILTRSYFYDLLCTCKKTAKVRKVSGENPNGAEAETISLIINGPQRGNTRITVACNSPFVLCICNRMCSSSVFPKLKVDCKEKESRAIAFRRMNRFIYSSRKSVSLTVVFEMVGNFFAVACG